MYAAAIPVTKQRVKKSNFTSSDKLQQRKIAFDCASKALQSNATLWAHKIYIIV